MSVESESNSPAREPVSNSLEVESKDSNVVAEVSRSNILSSNVTGSNEILSASKVPVVV